MKQLIDRVMNHPIVAHLMSALNRYSKRLGPQFAAAVTFFSVLSMLPMLMLGFAVIGWTVTVVHPEYLDHIRAAVQAEFGDSSNSISKAIEHALTSWNTVGITALVMAAYSGSNWVGNLKRAVRVMWCRKFSDAAETKNFLVELAINLVTFLGLVGCIALSAAVTQVGTSFSEAVLSYLGWSDVPGIGFFWQALAIVLVFIASWLLMAFLFLVLPNQSVRPRAWLTGTLIGAVLVTLLQSVAGRLFGLFGGNPAATLFGPVIVLMLVLNLFATMILITAAWVGTDELWRLERAERITSSTSIDGEIDIDEEAVRESSQVHSLDDLRRADRVSVRVASKENFVREDIAMRGAKFGWFFGYGVGTATGVGIGAVLVAAVRWLAKLRR